MIYSLTELFVDEGAGLEVGNGLLPRVFEDAKRLLLTLDVVVVDVHQENAFESIVNSQITACGTLLLRAVLNCRR